MIIRKLQISDTSAYRELRLEALQVSPEAFGSDYEESLQRPNSDFAARLQDRPGEFMLGAFDDLRLVGIVNLSHRSGTKVRHKADVYQMFVTPSCRGKRIGRSLMEYLIGEAEKTESIEWLCLSVVLGNDAAVNLYESLGFQPYGVEVQALKIGENYFDEVLMARVV